MCLFPGSIGTIEHFRAAGVRLGLVTNGDSEGQRAKIRRFGLESYFESIVIEGEFGVGKPDERIFRHTLGQLGVSGDEAWMVGDRLEWEIGPAQALGIQGIWVDVAGDGLPPEIDFRPDRIVQRIAELITSTVSGDQDMSS